MFRLEEEERLTIVEVFGRTRAAFDVERVTKRFYDQFQKQHATFLKFIKGIEAVADREWYASVMLNFLMFVYFIQRKGFLTATCTTCVIGSYAARKSTEGQVLFLLPLFSHPSVSRRIRV